LGAQCQPKQGLIEAPAGPFHAGAFLLSTRLTNGSVGFLITRMSLAFSFRLTPAQTTLLLKCAFGHYGRTENEPSSPLLPLFDSTHFVSIARNLEAKGLITHSNNREPSYLPTSMGIAMAEQIARDAAEIVKLKETSPGIPNPASKVVKVK
jgi:hypothetical protein